MFLPLPRYYLGCKLSMQQNTFVPEIQKQTADFICLNFANPDMVGHTGDLQAAIKACETVDECSEAVIEAAKAKKEDK